MKKVLALLSVLVTSAAFAQEAPSNPTAPQPNPIFMPKDIVAKGICSVSSDMQKMVLEAGYELLTYGISEMDKNKIELFLYNKKINNFTIIEIDLTTKEACMVISGVNMVLPQKNAEKFYNDMTHSKTADESSTH